MMINSGRILIQSDAERPEYFQAVDEVCPPAWTAISHALEPPALEAELSRTGWTFFFMANRLRTRAFGFDPARRMATALRRIVSRVREQGCNSVEIEGVATRSFLGVPYISVSARPRHIQEGVVFVAQ